MKKRLSWIFFPLLASFLFVLVGTIKTTKLNETFTIWLNKTGVITKYLEIDPVTNTTKIASGSLLVDTIASTGGGAPSFSSNLALNDGSAASPALNFTSDTNTGFFRKGADSVGFAAGGAEIGNYSSGSWSIGGTAGVQQIVGGQKWTVITVTSADRVLDTTTTDAIVLVNTGAASRNITLPPHSNGRMIIIKDIAGTAATYNIVASRNGGIGNIEGLAQSKTLSSNWGTWWFISDGTNWYMPKTNVARKATWCDSGCTYTSTQSWTAPAGVTTVFVTGCGGGAGGGEGGSSGGSGGGGAGLTTVSVSVVPNSPYTGTLGAGGSGGSGSPFAFPGIGGTTTFGALVSFYGPRPNGTNINGPIGGIGTTGGGTGGYPNGADGALRGDGAGSLGAGGTRGTTSAGQYGGGGGGGGRGAGGNGGNGNSGGTGIAGSNAAANSCAGGGGGGGSSAGSAAGGAGGSGYLEITWFD